MTLTTYGGKECWYKGAVTLRLFHCNMVQRMLMSEEIVVIAGMSRVGLIPISIAEKRQSTIYWALI